MDKIQLEEPIKIDGVEVKEISLRKPKVRDLIVAGKKMFQMRSVKSH